MYVLLGIATGWACVSWLTANARFPGAVKHGWRKVMGFIYGSTRGVVLESTERRSSVIGFCGCQLVADRNATVPSLP